MQPHLTVEVDVENGIIGDHRGSGGTDRKRQITLLSEELWEEVCQELHVPIPWRVRRANVLVSGLDFSAIPIGTKLRFGDDVILEVTGITKPCNRMDEQHQGLKDALHGVRGGFTCRVIQGGRLNIADTVVIPP